MREDIAPMADAILKRQCAGKPLVRLTGTAREQLVAYDFPGNVRELENVLERALALCTADEIAVEDLQLAPRSATEQALDVTGVPLQERLDALERKHIFEALEQTRYNRTAAAKILGITFRALRYRMERLGIKDELDAKS
jgi:two-component system, NtrC family, response regulator PilR